MAITQTTRFGLPQWSAGSDPPITRAQANQAFGALADNAAGWLTPDVAANRPAASAANAGFLFRASDTGALSLSTGSAWLDVPTGTAFLQTSGGTLTGALDFDGQEIRNPVVLSARDKRFTQSVAGALTVNANNGPNQTFTLTGNITGITLSNLDDGESLRLTFIQDGTGGRTVAWPGTWLWPGGATAATPAFATTPNAVNVLVLDQVDTAVHAFLAGGLKV